MYGFQPSKYMKSFFDSLCNAVLCVSPEILSVRRLPFRQHTALFSKKTSTSLNRVAKNSARAKAQNPSGG
jgi:hypothetical protein